MPSDRVAPTEKEEEQEEASLSSPEQFIYFAKTLQHTLLFLNCMVNEQEFIEYSTNQYKLRPSLILRYGKIVCVSRISTTRAKWDNQCNYKLHV
jgi:hypothetical protein